MNGMGGLLLGVFSDILYFDFDFLDFGLIEHPKVIIVDEINFITICIVIGDGEFVWQVLVDGSDRGFEL
jgi:hypothetical protein